MLITSKDVIPYEVMKVLETVRDHQADLVPYMPNIKAVEVIERRELDGNRIELLNHWHGESDVPAFVKKFIKPEMTSWKDYATWYNDERYVAWRLETFYLNKLFTCIGKTHFKEVGPNETEIFLEGDLKVYPEEVPGIPSFIAKKAAPQIEGFIVKLITPNLCNLAKGVKAYLDDNA
ncbi:MAG: hypothetical protein HQK79_14320 [Desulfobacterales bacterium]|nr:hypothetical protein [Desulfobacterales bacterium]MBF0396326.1 hypothetical protein [Desulfobacterales bacterium]